MHQYRYLIMAVYDDKKKDDTDKLGKHHEFHKAAKDEEKRIKEDRNLEFKAQNEEKNRQIQIEQRRRAEERKKDKRSFIGKPAAIRSEKPEVRKEEKKEEIDVET